MQILLNIINIRPAGMRTGHLGLSWVDHV